MRKSIISFLLALGILCVADLKALAYAADDLPHLPNQINELTKNIVLKEIELEKFNLHYRMEVGKQGRWAGWRYAAFQEANFGMNLASGVALTSERSSHFGTAHKLSRGKLEAANLTSMIGYIIGASAGALELGITEYHDLQAKHKGFSPKLAKAHILALKAEINRLLAEREILMKIEGAAPLLRPHFEEDLVEGQVLTDLRDLALLEYQRFHLDLRRFVAFQKSLYFLDATKYTCSAIGSLFAFMSQYKHDRKWNMRAGIMYDIAGTLIIATPFVSRGIGILVQKAQKRYTASVVDDVQTTKIAILEEHEAELEKICKRNKGQAFCYESPPKRLALYRQENHHFASEFDRIIQKERQGLLTATQNMIVGTYTGGCHLASGIIYTSVGSIAGSDSIRDANVTNNNLGAAAMVNIAGNSVAILDTLRIQAQAEIRRHKAAKEGKLSTQLFAKNLAELDRMEEKLTSTRNSEHSHNSIKF